VTNKKSPKTKETFTDFVTKKSSIRKMPDKTETTDAAIVKISSTQRCGADEFTLTPTPGRKNYVSRGPVPVEKFKCDSGSSNEN
jgi:hypothetical protein